MSPNAFVGKLQQPTDEELTAELGAARAAWDQLTSELAAEQDVTTQEWHSYSPKAGWAYRLKRAKRTIVYLSPSKGSFIVTFILGGKAIAAARESKLPKRIADCIDAGVKYPEGTGVRIAVKNARDIPAIKRLAALKIAN
jgi:hypothetical protein